MERWLRTSYGRGRPEKTGQNEKAPRPDIVRASGLIMSSGGGDQSPKNSLTL